MKALSISKIAVIVLMVTVVAACSSKRKAVKETPTETVAVDTLKKQAFLQKVTDNAQHARFITSKVKFSVEVGSRQMTLTGNLKMKRDDVIRLQLMAFGFVEAGRLEFTKEYVLVMDRINKLYLKVPYSHLDFLRNSSIDFYVLQALFWNELFQPGHREPVADAYTMKLQQDHVTLDYARDLLSYQWLVDRKKALIEQVSAVHGRGNDADKATLSWHYANFSSLENSVFPCDQQVTFAAKKRNVKMGFLLSSLSTDSDWETRTKVSGRYKKVTIDEVLDKIASMGV